MQPASHLLFTLAHFVQNYTQGARIHSYPDARPPGQSANPMRSIQTTRQNTAHLQ